MPRLSVTKRSRLIAIYYQYDIEITKKKYDRLAEQALEEEIIIIINRDLTARKLKNMFNLNVSTRSIQRCLNIMGWEKVRAKYCQAVSLKNRRERIAFATMAIHFSYQFDNSIFVDESTIQCTKNAFKK
jgi:hypothetical protein